MTFALSTHQGASTGFTLPSSTYEVMRQIETASAAPLNRDVEEYVASAPFKAAWRAWYNAWLDFFDTYASGASSTWDQLGAFVHSDEIADRTESFRRTLEDFYRTYPSELRANGTPVPMPRGKSPLIQSLPKVEQGFPWWVWAVGIGALGTLGYAGYRRLRESQRTAKNRKTR